MENPILDLYMPYNLFLKSVDLRGMMMDINLPVTLVTRMSQEVSKWLVNGL